MHTQVILQLKERTKMHTICKAADIRLVNGEKEDGRARLNRWPFAWAAKWDFEAILSLTVALSRRDKDLKAAPLQPLQTAVFLLGQWKAWGICINLLRRVHLHHSAGGRGLLRNVSGLFSVSQHVFFVPSSSAQRWRRQRLEMKTSRATCSQLRFDPPPVCSWHGEETLRQEVLV